MGSVCGWVDDEGYRHIRVDNTLYLAHRLAWLYVYGVWPTGRLDHKNTIAGDDRINNLRETDQSSNVANAKKSRANKSGFKGVSWRRNGWRAAIVKNRKQIHLGDFDTAEAAHIAYAEAARKIYGEFARP